MYGWDPNQVFAQAAPNLGLLSATAATAQKVKRFSGERPSSASCFG
jgi:hypothetical protein